MSYRKCWALGTASCSTRCRRPTGPAKRTCCTILRPFSAAPRCDAMLAVPHGQQLDRVPRGDGALLRPRPAHRLRRRSEQHRLPDACASPAHRAIAAAWHRKAGRASRRSSNASRSMRLPHMLNPEQGFISHANNMSVGTWYPLRPGIGHGRQRSHGPFVATPAIAHRHAPVRRRGLRGVGASRRRQSSAHGTCCRSRSRWRTKIKWKTPP